MKEEINSKNSVELEANEVIELYNYISQFMIDHRMSITRGMVLLTITLGRFLKLKKVSEDMLPLVLDKIKEGYNWNFEKGANETN